MKCLRYSEEELGRAGICAGNCIKFYNGVYNLCPDFELISVEEVASIGHEIWVQWSRAIISDILGNVHPQESNKIRNRILKKYIKWLQLWKPFDNLPEYAKKVGRQWAEIIKTKLLTDSIIDLEGKPDILEELAALEHDQWVQWSRDIIGQFLDDVLPGDSYEISRRVHLKHQSWLGLWKDYFDLPEEEKEKDRIWARKVLKKICGGEE